MHSAKRNTMSKYKSCMQHEKGEKKNIDDRGMKWIQNGEKTFSSINDDWLLFFSRAIPIELHIRSTTDTAL